MALTLRSVTQPGCADHRQQVVQRTLQFVIDNNIVEFRHMPHLSASRSDAASDRFSAIRGARAKPAFKFVK